jgi:hypothetical protein
MLSEDVPPLDRRPKLRHCLNVVKAEITGEKRRIERADRRPDHQVGTDTRLE